MARTSRSAHSGAVSARPTTTGFGKCTAPLKTLVPDEVKEAFVAASRELGYSSESDALRELVMMFTYGQEHLRKIHTNRIAAVAHNLSGIGTR